MSLIDRILQLPNVQLFLDYWWVWLILIFILFLADKYKR